MNVPLNPYNVRTRLNNHEGQISNHAAALNRLVPQVTTIDGWKTATSTWKDGIDTWKTDTATWKDNLDSWKTGTIQPFMTTTEARLTDLKTNKLATSVYEANKEKLDDRLENITGNLQRLTEFSLSCSKELTQIMCRLTALESRADDADTKVSKHDGKLDAHDADIVNVRKEIKDGNKSLGDRIEEHDKNMNKGFKRLVELINKQQNGPQPDGSGSGAEDSADSTSPLCNYKSPGGINVANHGKLSFHAPDCARRLDPSLYHGGNSTGPFFRLCPCQGLYGIPGPGYPPPIVYQSPSFARRSQSDSRSAEENSNYNYTPNFMLELGRTSGGGLFSKPRKETLQIELGRGG